MVMPLLLVSRGSYKLPLVCLCGKSLCVPLLQPVKTTDADEKKKYVLQEIYETERSFLSVLELVSQDFYLSLKDHIPPEDTELLFSIARVRGWDGGRICTATKPTVFVFQSLSLSFSQSLYSVHSALLEGFERCVEHETVSTKTDITKYFLDQQQGLLQYGLYAARLPLAVDKVAPLVVGRRVARWQTSTVC